MSEYDDDAERLADPCDLCGLPFYRCECDEEELREAFGVDEEELQAATSTAPRRRGQDRPKEQGR